MDLFKAKSIYQLSLRTITPEGTLKSAVKMFPHIASLGFDIVYLEACFAADNDSDEKSWSPRQREANCGNPKNPYKIVDYFHVDEEYGTDEDLKFFVDEAHKCDLQVIFDLVYLHCGKNAVFIKDNPDFVERNADGTTLVGEGWPFARLNFGNTELRKYLYENMRYLIDEYKADGFRCDVAEKVPFDFWEEGVRRLRKIKPDILFLDEGRNTDYTQNNTFDAIYHWEKNSMLVECYGSNEKIEEYKKFFETEKYSLRTLNYIDNHDHASDDKLYRKEMVYGNDGVESMTVLAYTIAGIPFIWNGIEVCDDLENCMFSNRFYGRRNCINWANALTEKGRRRMELIKRLSNLYHAEEALYDGTIRFEDADAEGVLCFVREKGESKLLVCVNTRNAPTEFKIGRSVDVILSKGAEIGEGVLKTEAYGYLIARVN